METALQDIRDPGDGTQPNRIPQEKIEEFTQMIDQLIKVRVAGDSPLTESFVLELLDYAEASLLDDCTLIDLKPPIIVCGDIHGDYATLLRIFSTQGWPPTRRYLFLGDYVDRGILSLEVITLLLLFKTLYPKDFYILRGNHEAMSVNRIYGFKREVSTLRFTKVLWYRFQSTFNCLPLAALIENKIFCVHGGISFRLKSLQQIRILKRPINLPNDGFLLDLLWADPSQEGRGFEPNEMRNASFTFSESTLRHWLECMGLQMLVRAHEVVPEGFEVSWDGKLITVFSCPNYTSGNKAAVMNISKQMKVTFTAGSSSCPRGSALTVFLFQKYQGKRPAKGRAAGRPRGGHK
ncbi:Metallophos domain containing protein [Trichuris trichiura]|uniref:Serine/threonine-protein phosphatase n=1 Tax=Trichuris trichiura TaxID=36087 RepID=A0A077ZHK7_TRITR|nr:Metallophos domain containing protein [Trichuris trichiura]